MIGTGLRRSPERATARRALRRVSQARERASFQEFHPFHTVPISKCYVRRLMLNSAFAFQAILYYYRSVCGTQ